MKKAGAEYTHAESPHCKEPVPKIQNQIFPEKKYSYYKPFVFSLVKKLYNTIVKLLIIIS
jgi:hypothetical protein